MAENQVQNPSPEKVIALSASLLDPFQGHPFRVASGEEMEQLKESIREYGVLSPLLVRPRGDGRYEIVSGHRRRAACEALGITELPVLVRDMTDDEAVILMVDSNIQREHILPSEKAFAYKMKMEAIRHQGKRGVPTSSQVGMKLQTMDIVGQESGDSRNQVHRYIRLTHLIPSILQMVDEYQIAFNPAVEISYLTEEHQRMLKEEMDACQATPSLTQSRTLKQMSQSGTLTREYLHHLLTEEKPNQRQKFFLNQEDVQRYFPKHYTPQQMQQVILHLLHTWQHKRGYNKENEGR
ncbi:ParB/RepB/Spo0J family partition protein [uncultured Subdoligranulum sp.]|uniref:ParB/RepB/Spo0J family partition protein n=1 Tax=uncultured Subdoligranulum sp. TaxID=512298 RepID=UPI0025FEA4CC|nr:ParB/RepB/Spo0J family partition protein [uncultured Subdoligranulum sp.]